MSMPHNEQSLIARIMRAVLVIIQPITNALDARVTTLEGASPGGDIDGGDAGSF